MRTKHAIICVSNMYFYWCCRALVEPLQAMPPRSTRHPRVSRAIRRIEAYFTRQTQCMCQNQMSLSHVDFFVESSSHTFLCKHASAKEKKNKWLNPAGFRYRFFTCSTIFSTPSSSAVTSFTPWERVACAGNKERGGGVGACLRKLAGVRIEFWSGRER